MYLEEFCRCGGFYHGRPMGGRERKNTMSLIKCKKCGEMFSDSYKECPFCLEDEEFNGGRKPRNPGRRVQKPKAPSILGPAMLVVVLLLAGYLVYTFLGTDIAQWFDGGEDKPGINQPVQGDDQPGKDEGDEGKDDPTQPTATVTLDKSNLVLEAGKSEQLTAAGAEGITFHSSDEAVATVDAAGKVTAVSVGSATITASADGATSAACVVTVNPAPKKLVLQSIYGTKNDITIKVGGVAPMMVDGTDSAIQWSMENSSVASVDSKGNVKGLRNGMTKVIATVDGQTLTCIIRVN